MLITSPARSLAGEQVGAGEKYELVLGIPVRTPAERGESQPARPPASQTTLYKSVDPKISIFALTSLPLPPSFSLCGSAPIQSGYGTNFKFGDGGSGGGGSPFFRSV